MIEVTVAVKPAVVAPAPTVTLPGTVAFALLLDSATASPPPGAAPLSVTVQLEVPGAFTLDGLQDRLLGVTSVGWITVIAPPVPDEGTEFPSALETTTPLVVTGTLVLVLLAEIVNVATATGPLAIVVVFSPNTMHVTGVPEHATLLPAAIADEPATTETPVAAAG